MTGIFRPLTLIDGYPPIEDHGLIGDGRGAALVARDGCIDWMCVPRFDSPPLFCGLLDRHRGGAFRVTPVDLRESRQYYHEDTGVLVTELRTGSGLLELTDAFTLRTGADLARSESASTGELVRQVRVRHGRVDVQVVVDPRGDVDVSRVAGGWRLRGPAWPDVVAHLACSAPLDGLRTTWDLTAGDEVQLRLVWADGEPPAGGDAPGQRLASTIANWRRWATCIRYDGPQAPLVRRSAVTLKLLDHAENGAIIAAPTSSLPESIGGPRNWDYRYTWVRDAAFSVYALRRLGLGAEAESFLSWVLRAVERDQEPRVLYNLDGHQPPPEWVDPSLEGYRRSQPVRWGNGAADQTQHDVYGEILDCAYQWVGGGGRVDASLWTWLSELTERARTRWQRPDHGIWEVRTTGRRFTYSVALCQVALDRAAKLATRFDLPGDAPGWAAEAEKVREAVLEQAWDPEIGAITEHLERAGTPGPAGLDASVLALPLRRVVPSTHPKMVATTRAVRQRLDAGDGLLYRYRPEESPDGLPGHEGAFLLCSFWLVDNLAHQGRVDEATALYESLCARANPLGLLPEEIDPGTGGFLGNFPQAFSHVGVISSGLNLVRASGAGQRSERSRS